MGGYGSGCRYQWWRPARKTTVEECLDLDARRWQQRRILADGVHLSGTWRWTYPSGAEATLSFEVDTADQARPFLRLRYGWAATAAGPREPVDLAVPLTVTRAGGMRWWFVCPLQVRGVLCRRRVGKLYLPPGGRYFGCRHCHNLTYTSTQTQSRSRRRLGFAALLGHVIGSTVKKVCREVREQ